MNTEILSSNAPTPTDGSEVELLRIELERVRARGDEYQRLYFDLLEKFMRWERGLLQSKSERKSVVDEQLGLALVAMSYDHIRSR